MVDFICADKKKFAAFHTIYTDSNIFARYDWNERVEDAIDCTLDKNCLFIHEDKRMIGGFTLKDNNVSYPFMVPPYSNRKEFWGIVLSYAAQVSGQKEIILHEIPEVDTQVLTRSYNATLRWSKRKMLRPTEAFSPILGNGFSFGDLTEKDISEITQVIFDAHSAGHTSTVWEPNMTEIKNAVVRRFSLFGETNTLHMSNVVVDEANQKIAGVCIAGIYPDSPYNFATIHQVSVRPEYRRKGLAKAMMLKSINDAHAVSPVMTLGVLVGNPAEILYKEIGIASGPSYSELSFTCI